ncbi:cupin domain-containing protein [Streptomyces rimosus]|uniref:cupin domain-containing protein n=1 Tax=Streptomyces rimosus TaxID=1927 RepID=UPI00067CA9AE|nr:hypothetical protein [Streptomyces rimosus]
MVDAQDAHIARTESAAPAPQLLCDINTLVAEESLSAGALWRLAEPGRQLDANLIHLRPGEVIAVHTEPDLDVLIFVVAGHGTLGTAHGTQPLAEGRVAWLPRNAPRSLAAGKDGMSYVTVHRRRPGMQIRTRPEPHSA